MKMIKILPFIVIVLFLISIVSAAEYYSPIVQGDPYYDKVQQGQTLWDRLVNWLKSSSQTVVGGKECSTFPSFSGEFSGATNVYVDVKTTGFYFLNNAGPSQQVTITGGVAFQVFDITNNWAYKGEIQKLPGQRITFLGLDTSHTYHWDIYICNNDLICTNSAGQEIGFTKQTCGGTGMGITCSSTKVLTCRDCSINSLDECVCISDPSCTTTTPTKIYTATCNINSVFIQPSDSSLPIVKVCDPGRECKSAGYTKIYSSLPSQSTINTDMCKDSSVICQNIGFSCITDSQCCQTPDKSECTPLGKCSPIVDATSGGPLTVEFVNLPSSVQAGNEAIITVKVSNTGSSATRYVDVGIQLQSFIKQYMGKSDYVFSLTNPLQFDMTNCVGNEPNVQTKKVFVGSGQSINIEFKVIVPQSSGDYAVAVGSFTACGTSYQDWKAKAITVTGGSIPTQYFVSCIDDDNNKVTIRLKDDKGIVIATGNCPTGQICQEQTQSIDIGTLDEAYKTVCGAAGVVHCNYDGNCDSNIGETTITCPNDCIPTCNEDCTSNNVCNVNCGKDICIGKTDSDCDTSGTYTYKLNCNNNNEVTINHIYGPWGIISTKVAGGTCPEGQTCKATNIEFKSSATTLNVEDYSDQVCGIGTNCKPNIKPEFGICGPDYKETAETWTTTNSDGGWCIGEGGKENIGILSNNQLCCMNLIKLNDICTANVCARDTVPVYGQECCENYVISSSAGVGTPGTTVTNLGKCIKDQSKCSWGIFDTGGYYCTSEEECKEISDVDVKKLGGAVELAKKQSDFANTVWSITLIPILINAIQTGRGAVPEYSWCYDKVGNMAMYCDSDADCNAYSSWDSSNTNMTCNAQQRCEAKKGLGSFSEFVKMIANTLGIEENVATIIIIVGGIFLLLILFKIIFK